LDVRKLPLRFKMGDIRNLYLLGIVTMETSDKSPGARNGLRNGGNESLQIGVGFVARLEGLRRVVLEFSPQKGAYSGASRRSAR